MKSSKFDVNRRTFFRQSLFAVSGLVLLPALKLSRTHSGEAYGAGLEMVKESDPAAAGLQYVAKKSWPATATAEQKTSLCKSCNWYQSPAKSWKNGISSDKTAPCTMFAMKGVAAAGWCSAWAKKV